MTDCRVYLCSWERVDKDSLRDAIDWCGRWEQIGRGTRVLIKPNLTLPFHEPGVTPPPDTIRALTELLLERSAEVAICEGGPSLDSFSLQDSFKDHGILDLRDEYGIRVIDLRDEPVTHRSFGRKRSGRNVPIPVLLEKTDVFVSMPMVKVHAMTKVTLAMKNQWGIIPTRKRFLFHPALDDILVGLNALLPNPLVVCDARTVMDEVGPAFGTPRPANFLAVGNDPGAFDFALSYLMGFDPMEIGHIRAGVKAGTIPDSLEGITLNADLLAFRPFKFTLRRSLQNYVALMGFNNRLICKLGYDSLIGDFLHRLLYTIKKNPMKEATETRVRHARAW
jgi:uncharacterized protein (DUF362 family)